MTLRIAVLVASFFAAVPAHAHPFHGAGDFAAGLVHPFLGLDHLLAMLAIGVWAARSGARAVWAVPCAFVVAMLAGFAFAMAGLVLPAVEPMIAASVLVLGLLVASRRQLAASVCMLVAGAFAVSHGFAHAVEIPSVAAAWSYAAGFVVATVALHLIGLGLGGSLRARFAGIPIALAGAWMLIA